MKLRDRHRVHWHDSGKEPECAPNPEFPEGVDLDVSFGASRTCTVKLPYPARRCGSYLVECTECGLNVAATTAGRPDDPRSIRHPEGRAVVTFMDWFWLGLALLACIPIPFLMEAEKRQRRRDYARHEELKREARAYCEALLAQTNGIQNADGAQK